MGLRSTLSLSNSCTDVLDVVPHRPHFGIAVAFSTRHDWWHRQRRELRQHLATAYWWFWRLQKWSCLPLQKFPSFLIPDWIGVPMVPIRQHGQLRSSFECKLDGGVVQNLLEYEHWDQHTYLYLCKEPHV